MAVAKNGLDNRRTVACHIDIGIPPGDAKKAERTDSSPSIKFVTGSSPLVERRSLVGQNCSTNDFLSWTVFAHVNDAQFNDLTDQNRNFPETRFHFRRKCLRLGRVGRSSADDRKRFIRAPHKASIYNI
jgi:hypothetical protein